MAYQKQKWNNYNDSLSIEQNKANNAFATAEGLNHIEEGIASKADKFTTEQSLAVLNQQVADKISLSTLSAGLLQKRDVSVKLGQNDISESLLQQITGNAPVNAIPNVSSLGADKLIMDELKVDWLLGAIAYSSGWDQTLEGYIKTGFIYAPKGTSVILTDQVNYKYSIHLYDIETQQRTVRVWEHSEKSYTVPVTCLIRVTVSNNPIKPVTNVGEMGKVIKINRMFTLHDVERYISEIEEEGKNTLIPLACFTMYRNNERAESIYGINHKEANAIKVINKSANYRIGIRQRDKNGLLVIDNGWTDKEKEKKISFEFGSDYIQVVFSRSDDAPFSLKEIPFNRFEMLFDNVNINRLLDFNLSVFNKSNVGNENSVTLNPKDANIKGVNHRGFHTKPENTLEAYRESKRQGFSYVETDVRWTQDNIPVLLHDYTINRTARNVDGSVISETKAIWDITYQEAVSYDYGFHKGASFKGVKLPTLDEFLMVCKRLNLNPYIEIKSGNTSQVTDMVNRVSKVGMADNVTYIGGDLNSLEEVKALNPKARIGHVTDLNTTTHIDRLALLKTTENEVFLDASINALSKELIEYAHSKGVSVEVWTLNREADVKLVSEMGIDGITTDNLNIMDVLNY